MRCLIIDEMHPSIGPLLAGIGIQSDYQPAITRPQVLDIIGGYEGVIARSKLRLDKEIIAQAKSLLFIGRAGAGLDNIDLASAAAADVQIFNAPEGNSDAVAEHTLGLMLATMNKICLGNEQVRQGLWDRDTNRGVEIFGKTVGLIGYGNMGRAVAQRLTAFGCQVLAYDKYLKDWPDHNALPVPLARLQAEADIVSLHVPLTYETRGWFNARLFASFAKPIYLFNTARGEIIQLLDLLYAIKTGRVLAAGLDVLENEKMEDMLTLDKIVLQALASSGRVIFTPHVAGWTNESYIRINEVLVHKIAAFLVRLPK